MRAFLSRSVGFYTLYVFSFSFALKCVKIETKMFPHKALLQGNRGNDIILNLCITENSLLFTVSSEITGSLGGF